MTITKQNVAFIPLSIFALIGLGAAGVMSIEPLVALAGTDTPATVVRTGTRSGKYGSVQYLVVKVGGETTDVRVTGDAAGRAAPGRPVTVRVGPGGIVAAAWADHTAPVSGIVISLVLGVVCLGLAINAARRRPEPG